MASNSLLGFKVTGRISKLRFLLFVKPLSKYNCMRYFTFYRSCKISFFVGVLLTLQLYSRNIKTLFLCYYDFILIILFIYLFSLALIHCHILQCFLKFYFLFAELSNPPSATASEKQSPMAQQHSPKAQPNTAASQSNPAAVEPHPSAAQPNPAPHHSPVTQLPVPPPQTYTHDAR